MCIIKNKSTKKIAKVNETKYAFYLAPLFTPMLSPIEYRLCKQNKNLESNPILYKY